MKEKEVLLKQNINAEGNKVIVLDATKEGVTLLVDDGTEKWIVYENDQDGQEGKRIKINEKIISNIYTAFAKGIIRW